MGIDPTFYRTAQDAIDAPVERVAYVAAFDRDGKESDALVVVDVDPKSPSYAQVIGRTDVPGKGGELHHFGWNACSSALKHEGHCIDNLARRYLLLPELRGSNVHVIDTQPDPRKPKHVKTISAKEISDKAGYSRPHTLHCGPDGVYLTCLGGRVGEDDDGPGGIVLLDHSTFEVQGSWEKERGDVHYAYDAWWHLNRDVLISSEWGSPSMLENGLVPEDLLSNKYGHRIHFWQLSTGKLQQSIDLGAHQQMVLELRPSHDPEKAYGFAGVVISTEDLSANVFHWYWDEAAEQWAVNKVITIPAEPASEDELPPALKPFKAVPPLVTDIDLSVDDRTLYVSCWGTGEIKQYDVTDPAHPKETGSVRLGGVVSRAAHPSQPERPLAGGPQMVEISRDGRRVYLTNSLYGAWDDQFYPDGVGAWMVKLDADPKGGLQLDESFFLETDKVEGLRLHQVRLQGGDASSDSYCYRS